MRILVPYCDSPNAAPALRAAIGRARRDPSVEIHLLAVDPPLPIHVSRHVGRRERLGWHRERAEKATSAARRLLERSGVRHALHFEVGEPATRIARAATRLSCDLILMSTARKDPLTRMLGDSTTNEVLELTRVPVEVIVGDAPPALQRYGPRAAIGTALAFLLLETVD